MKNTLQNVIAVFFGLLIFGLTAKAQQLSYHGRIVDTVTNLGVTGPVTFRVQIRTPTTAGFNCVMYEESIPRNLVNGVFVIGLNNGTGTPAPGNLYTVQQVFSNKNTFGAFNFPAGDCADSAPHSYAPGATDSRRVAISFNDASMAPGAYEPLPTQTVAYVPGAVEALNVGGFSVDALMRVVDGTGAPYNVTPLNNTQYTELINTLTNNSSFYLRLGDPAVGFTGALAGDVTGTQGATSVVRIRGVGVSATAPTPGQVLAYNGTNWIPTTDGGGTVTNVSSANAYLTVATPTSTPVLTLNVGTVANTVAAGNDARITGAIQSGSAAGGDLGGTFPNPTVATVGGRTSAQINTSVTDTIAATSSNTANAIVRRNASGDISVNTVSATNTSTRNVYVYDATNTNYVQIQAPAGPFANYTLTLPNSAGSNGFVLGTNGSGDLSWVSPTAGAVTGVSASLPLSSSGGFNPNITISQAGNASNGYLSSTDWTTFNNKLSATLASGEVWVGNAAAVPTSQFLKIGNIRSNITPATNPFFNVAGACAAGQTLTYSSITDQVSCSAYSITSGQVTSALGFTPITTALPAGQVLLGNASNVATATTLSGDITVNSSGDVTIANNAVTTSKILDGAVTDAKIASIDWAKIAVATRPNSIAGYGIIDAVLINAGGISTMQASPDASRPAFGVFGRVYISPDTREIWYDTGSAWVRVGSNAGLGGTVTSLDATLPLSVINNTTTPVVSMTRSSVGVDGYLASTDFVTFNNKLTSALTTGNIFVGVGGVATSVVPSGDISSVTGGVFTLANTPVVAGSNYTKFNVDSKGRIISATSINSSDVTTALTYTPVNRAGDTMAGNLNMGGFNISNTGNIAMATNRTFTISNLTAGQETTLVGTLGSADVGKAWFNATTNQIKYWDGSAAIAVASTVGSISSLNGLTATSQTFATSSIASNDFAISSAGSVHTFNIPTAGPGAARGLLTSGDWTTFNNKLGTTTVLSGDVSGTYNTVSVDRIKGASVSAVAPTNAQFLIYNGTQYVARTLSGDATLSSAGAFTLNNTGVVASVDYTKVTVDAKGRVTAAGRLTSADISGIFGNNLVSQIVVNPPLTIDNTNPGNPSIGMDQADSTTDGFLTMSDWNVFNQKVSDDLTSGRIFVGNVSNKVQQRVATGDLTLSNTGVFTLNDTIGSGGTSSKVTYDTKGRITAVAALNSADITTALGFTPPTSALASGEFYIGNASGVAQNRAITGEVTFSNTGVSSLSTTGVAAGSNYTKFNVDNKGRITSATNINSLDVTTALGYTPSNAALPSTQIFVGNATGIAQARTLSGDATIDNTGVLTLANTIGSSGTSSKVTYDAKGRITAVAALNSLDITTALTFTPISNALTTGNMIVGVAGVATSVVPSGDITSVTGGVFTLANTAVVPSSDYTKVTVDGKGRVTSAGRLTSADLSALYGFTPSTSVLTAGNIFVGSASNVATGVVPSGDISSISSSGVFTLANTIGSSGTSSKVTYDAKGRITASAALNSLDITTALGFTPSSAALPSAQIFVGNASGVAQGRTLSGDASIDNTGALTLATVATAGTYSRVTVDAKGRVTTGFVSADLSAVTGTLAVANGGTGSNTLTSGSLLLGNGTGALNTLAGGVTGNVLYATSPTTWAAASADTAGLVDKASVQTISGAKTFSAATTHTNYVMMNAQNTVRFGDADSSNYVALRSPGVVSTDVTFTLPGSDGTNGQVIVTNGAGALSWASVLTSTLASGDILVGNSAGNAQARTLTGDIAVSNTGVVSLANTAVVAGSNYTKFNVDSKGRIISATNINSSDVTTALGFTPASATLASANIFVGNATGSAQARALTGDASIDNAGLLTLANTAVVPSSDYSKVTVDSKGRVTSASRLNSADISAIFGGSLINSVQANAPVTVDITDPTNPVIGMDQADTSTNGFITSVDWNIFNQKVSDDLTSGRIFVGNATNKVQQRVASGDLTLSNTGIFTLNNTIGSGGTSSKVTYDTKGRITAVAALNSADITTALGFTPSSATLASGEFFIGNASGVAQNRTITGEATISNAGVLSLSTTGVTAGANYTRFTVDNKGRLTAASNLVSTDISALYGYTPSTSTLTAGNIFVGNASNVATGVVPSGDISSITSAGIFTLANTAVVAGSNYTKFNVDGKGRIISATNINSSDVTTALGFTPASATLASANIFVGNATGSAQARALTGDASIDNAGVLSLANTIGSTGTSSKVTYDAKGRITAVAALNSADITTALTFTPVSATLASANIFVGNATGSAQARALTGDASIDNAGVLTLANTIGSTGTSSKVTYDAKGRITAVAALNSADITTALGFTPSSATLASGDFFIGNGSGLAQARTITGDVTFSNAGLSVLANTAVVAGSNYTKFNVDGKGRIISATNINSSDVTTALGFTPASATLASANIFVGNATGSAQARALTGDASIDNAGLLTLANTAVVPSSDYSKVTVDSKGRVTSASRLNSADISAIFGGSLINSVQANAPVTVDITDPTNPVIGMDQADTSTNGFITSVDWNIFNQKVSDDLTSGRIFVGNATNKVQQRVASGDLTLSNTGIFTLNNTIGSGGTSSKVTYDTKGRITAVAALNSADITTALGFTPSTATLASGEVYIGNATGSGQGRVITGEATISNAGVLSLSTTGVTAGANYTRFTVDNKGRLTAASNLVSTDISTLYGYTPSSSTLTAGNIFVGNASNVATGVVPSGDISSITSAGIFTLANTIGSGGTSSKVTYDTKGRITAVAALNSADITTALTFIPMSATLASGEFFIGNATGSAQARTITGDVTFSNTGVSVLANTAVVAGSNYTKFNVDGKGRIISATNINSSDVTTALGFTPASATLASANIFVGNATGSAQARALTGDASIDNAGMLTLANTIGSTGTSSKVTYDAKGRITAVAALNSADITTALTFTPMSATLASANIFVGNASGAAQARTLAGDATIDNAGSLTLANTAVVAGSNYSKFNVDSKGRVISATTLTSTDITTYLGFTPASATLASANIFVGNASGSAQARALTGDASIDNAGVLTLANTIGSTGTSSKVTYDAKGRITAVAALNSADITTALTFAPLSAALASGEFFIGNATGSAQNRTITGEATISNTGVLALSTTGVVAGANYTRFTVDNKGRLTAASNLVSTDISTLYGYTPSTSTLTAGNIFVGNASNVSVGVVPSGDISSISSAGIFTLANTIGSGGTSSKVTYDTKGRITAVAALNSADITTALGFTPSSATLASGNIFVGNASGSAQARTIAGDATIDNAGSLILATVATAGTYSSVTVDAKGRVTAGTVSTDLSVVTGTLGVANGGTGATTLTSNGVLLGNGTGAVTATAAGANNTVLRVPAGGGAPTFGAIDLSLSAVVGTSILPIANGGTGSATTSSNFVFAGPNGSAGAPLFRALASADISSIGFIQGGNSYGATAVIGTNDAQQLHIETNNAVRISADTSGAIQFNGQGYSHSRTCAAGASCAWDANTTNVMVFNSGTTVNPTITVTNMKPGGSYMLVVQASGAGTGAINMTCNGAAPSYIPANGTRVVSGAKGKSVYTMMWDGADCLVTWITGF